MLSAHRAESRNRFLLGVPSGHSYANAPECAQIAPEASKRGSGAPGRKRRKWAKSAGFGPEPGIVKSEEAAQCPREAPDRPGVPPLRGLARADRIVPMRTVPITAAAVWLAAVGGLLEASPFAGLDQAPGVYVTVDGHGITIRQSAVDWAFYLPGGAKAEWKVGRGYGLPPHVKITCRAEGGYRPAAGPAAVWTVPRPDGMPKGLGRKQRSRWNRLWPWTFGDSPWHDEDSVDLGLSAIVEGTGAVLSSGTESNRFTVRLRFQVDPETAAAARQLAKHCTATF